MHHTNLQSNLRRSRGATVVEYAILLMVVAMASLTMSRLSQAAKGHLMVAANGMGGGTLSTATGGVGGIHEAKKGGVN
jgi:Flp pilus assembly pilin Flp